MEAKSWAVPFAAIAPIAWGSTYYVTSHFLPPDRPLFSAVVRALPFGLVLLAFRPQLPSGVWWIRAGVLGVLNIGAFFTLIFIAAYRLPGGLAATLTATTPLAIAALAWLLLSEQPRRSTLVGAVVGVAGVAVLVLRSGFAVDAIGVVASFAAVALFALGSVLAKRWRPPVDVLTFTAWQLVAGGLALLPVAVIVEGAPPEIGAREFTGYLLIGGFGTLVAYAVWFRGLQAAPANVVAMLGLLNPVAGMLLGVALAGEHFGPAQAIGSTLVLSGIMLGQPALMNHVHARLRKRRPVTQ